jgi:nitronate monooxygenase
MAAGPQAAAEEERMWPNRSLIELFEIEHPLVLAPMAGLGTVGLAASVCEAGGLGSIGCATMQPQLVAKTIQELRGLTSKPINVNFFCHAQAKLNPDGEHAWQERLLPYYHELGIDYEPPRSRLDIAPFGDAVCTVIEEAKPEVVSFHFGLPAPALLARVKAAGCRVMSSATTVEEALWLEAGGVDAIIAQGYEAGGHRGMFLAPNLSSAIVSQPGSLPLVPQIVDAVSVPVVAAGGIADGRGIAAAFALGAAGTQLGTAYLLCPEAATTPLYRDALRHARGDATLMTNVFSGRPARILVNRLALDVGPILDAPLDFPFPMAELQPLRAKAEQEGSTDFTPFWSGQAAPMAKEMPAKALTVKLATEALERFKQLGGLSKSGPSPLTVI